MNRMKKSFKYFFFFLFDCVYLSCFRLVLLGFDKLSTCCPSVFPTLFHVVLNIVDHLALLFVPNRRCCNIPSSFNGDAVEDDAIDDDDDFIGIFAAFNGMLLLLLVDVMCVFVSIGVWDDWDDDGGDDGDGGIDNREVVVAVTLVEFLERGGGRIGEMVVFDRRFKLDDCLNGSDVKRWTLGKCFMACALSFCAIEGCLVCTSTTHRKEIKKNIKMYKNIV